MTEQKSGSIDLSFLKKAKWWQSAIVEALLIGIILSAGWAVMEGANVNLNTSVQDQIVELKTLADDLNKSISQVNATLVQNLDGAFYSLQRSSDYVVAFSSPYYTLQNGTTGSLDYFNTNETLVQQFAVGNLTVTGGSVYLKDMQFDHSIVLPIVAPYVLIEEDYDGNLNFYGGTSAVASPTGPYSYIISTDGTNCYAKNGTDGQIVNSWTTTDFSTFASHFANNTVWHINSGTYSLTGQLALSSLYNFTLSADEWNTKFVLSNTINTPVFLLISVANSVFHGFYIDAKGETANSAISTDSACHDNIYDQIYVTNAFHGGIEVYGSRNTIKNSRFINEGDDGIIVHGTANSVVSNIVENTTNHNLISLYGATGCTVSSNTLDTYLTTPYGIALESGCIENNIVGNTISAAASMISVGIYLYPSIGNDNNHVADNTMTLNGSRSVGVQVRSGNFYNDIVSNHICNVTYGVRVDDSNNAVNQNYIEEAATYGIYYSAGGNAQVNDNCIVGANTLLNIGIRITASNITCNGNTLYGGTSIGLYLSGGATGISTGTISSNTLIRFVPASACTGIYLENCTNMQITGDTLQGWTNGIKEVGAGNYYNTIVSSSTRGCTNGILTVGANTHVDLCWNVTTWIP